MKTKDILLDGTLYAVEYPRTEASMGYGYGDATVKATPLATGVQRPHSSKLDGVWCRLEERLRVSSGDPQGWGELAVGWEFVSSSAKVLGVWGEYRSVGLGRVDDEERLAGRERRYREQDFLREKLPELLKLTIDAEGVHSRGVRGHVRLKGDEVEIDRGWLARVLRSLELRESALMSVFVGQLSEAGMLTGDASSDRLDILKDRARTYVAAAEAGVL